MKNPHRLAFLTLTAALAGSFPALRADNTAAAPTATASAFVPPTPEAAAAAGLLPPDKVIVGKKHSLLDRWTKSMGLSDEQRLWIEPQLHAEEGLSKPVLAYKALTDDERQQIMLIVKLASRRQIMILLTPEQQKLMQQEIETTKANGR